MSIIGEMPVKWVLENYENWEEIIDEADPYLGPQSGVIIVKDEYLQHPKEYFNNIVDSSLSSFPERQGGEVAFQSYRIRDYPDKGYHLHEFNGFYLLHRDTYDPKDFESGIKHLIHDTSPSEKLIMGVGAFALGQLLFGGKKKINDRNF